MLLYIPIIIYIYIYICSCIPIIPINTLYPLKNGRRRRGEGEFPVVRGSESRVLDLPTA